MHTFRESANNDETTSNDVQSNKSQGLTSILNKHRDGELLKSVQTPKGFNYVICIL